MPTLPNSSRHTRMIARLVVIAAVFAMPTAASAKPGHQAFRFDLQARILGVRAIDWNRDGRMDLVVMVADKQGGPETLVLLPSPTTPTKGTFFQDVQRVKADGAAADAGAVAVGHFAGGAVLRFFGPGGLHDVAADGKVVPAPEGAQRPGTLLARSAGKPLVFWDGVGDLDGDGTSECWFPLATGEGAIRVARADGIAGRTLSLRAQSQASVGDDYALGREATIPQLVAADLDGDGTRDLFALRDTRLLAWNPMRAKEPAGPLAPCFSLELPFLEADPTLPPEALRTARVQLADVDADGTADMLVTFLTGRRDKLGDLKTILFHYAGPFRGKDGRLTRPASRIDTPSVVLHPMFVDVDGDGDLDYVADSIRTSNIFELVARVMGKDPAVTLEGFRFDKAKRRFESAPAFRLDRVYPSSEAMGNTFGQTAWFGGDFDGDGHKDLLDLGNLEKVEVVAGGGRAGGRIHFAHTLLGPYPMQDKLEAHAIVADFNGDKRDDCVFWSKTRLLLLVSGGS